jgi:small subunit ribosomal protein S33
MSKFSPAILELIKESSRKVFGHLPVVPYRTGNKLLRQKPTGPLAINHFPINSLRDFKKAVPEFKTEKEDRRHEKLMKLKKFNLGPPKKGQGKRSKNK